jgi:hypothetical protein
MIHPLFEIQNNIIPPTSLFRWQFFLLVAAGKDTKRGADWLPFFADVQEDYVRK